MMNNNLLGGSVGLKVISDLSYHIVYCEDDKY